LAANFSADERNAELKFHFMIHADKKSAGKWQDMPIPFPAEKNQEDKRLIDKSGISQLPQQLRGIIYKE
jgi:hypothetical protein